ncbi:MAG: spore coat protein [Clostridia bacterium]|nr:spore coat protein [Clostridia bacterium]
MNEQQQRMICETILMETKGLCDLYMHGTIESATPNVRAAFDQGLKDCLNMQQTVYDKMAQMGWYPPSQAPQDQLNQLKQKFMNMQ